MPVTVFLNKERTTGMLLYLLGVFIPPLAILLYGKIIYAAFNALLWTYAILTPGVAGMALWVVASLHASHTIYNARLSGIRH